MDKKVIVVGWDGASRVVLERGIEEGWLPTLKSFLAGGSLLDLISTLPPSTIPAWTSCFTGVNPGIHGYFDFTEFVSNTYQIRFTNSTYRKFPAIWNWLTRVDGQCVVIGVPGTYPVEEINGLMVAGFDSPLSGELTPDRVYPRNKFDLVRPWSYGGLNQSRIKRNWHERALETLLKRLEHKSSVIEQVLDTEPWDLCIVVFNESDTVCHHFWMFWDEKSPRFRQSGYKDAIPDVFHKLDQTFAKILDKVEKHDAVILLVSDHGFQPASTTVLHLNNWLSSKGLLEFQHSPLWKLLKRLALHSLPYTLQHLLFQHFRGYAERLESRVRFSHILWNRTTAFSEELDYFPSIRLNVQNRELHGIVAESDYHKFIHQLCNELRQWEWIKGAYPRDEVYKGPYVSRAPDIILELADNNGSAPSCLRSYGGPVTRELTPREFLGAREQALNGKHHRLGILCCSEPLTPTHANIEDVSATISALLQIPVPPLEGKPLLGTLCVDHSLMPTYHDERELTAYEEWLLLQQMRELGYWQ